MSDHDEDDKPTIVLDLIALKKQALKQEEELASLASELKFSTHSTSNIKKNKPKTLPLGATQASGKTPVILFDFQSNVFKNNFASFPSEYQYEVVTNLTELNTKMKVKRSQIVVFNYDVIPKAINQLIIQIKEKFPKALTLIMAESISEKKVKIHSATVSGAHGYYQFPIEENRLSVEFLRLKNLMKA